MTTLEADAALSSFATLVDPKVGVIRAVDFVKLAATDPRVHLAYAEPCDTTPLAGIAASNKGAACAVSADDAVIRACGECVERYCSAFWRADALVCATRRELEATGARALDAAAFHPFADAQHAAPGFPYARPDADRPARWVATTSLATGEAVHVPAGCVYVPYRFGEDDAFTHMPISTGLAAGRDVATCVDKGLCEVLERDALMIVWNARIPAPRLDPATCLGVSPTIDRLLGAIAGGRARWHLNLLTLDVEVPVIGAALIDDAAPPRTSFGIAAHVDPARALRSALEEALLTRLLVNRSSDVVAGDDHDVADLRTLRGHLVAHASSPALRDRMRFLTDDGQRTTFAEIRARYDGLGTVGDRVRRAGLEGLWVEVTTPDVADLGFVVTRSLIPGAQPLDNDHAHRHEGGRRLSSVPRSLGHPVPVAWNPDPHPFP